MKEIINAFKANPKEAVIAVVTVSLMFAAFYGVIWVGSAIGLQ